MRQRSKSLSDGEEGLCLYLLLAAIGFALVSFAVKMDSLKDRSKDMAVVTSSPQKTSP